MKVTFINETSHDAGGLSREYFSMLMNELLSPERRLFQSANTTEFSYKINEDSIAIENSLQYFYFFGQILGKALFDHIPLNVCLNRSVLKALLG